MDEYDLVNLASRMCLPLTRMLTYVRGTHPHVGAILIISCKELDFDELSTTCDVLDIGLGSLDSRDLLSGM